MHSLKMNKLSSAKTQLPYEYYSLPYCRPPQIISSAENLGEVLRGDRIVNSKYQVRISCSCASSPRACRTADNASVHGSRKLAYHARAHSAAFQAPSRRPLKYVQLALHSC